MSDTPERKDLLSALDLGPAWAREAASPKKKYEDHRGEESDRRGGRGPGGRRDRGDRRERGGARRDDFRGRDGRRGEGGPRGGRDLPEPARGVRVTLLPDREAVHKVVREIHHVARVYSLFDISQLLLAERGRYRLKVTMDPKGDAMFAGRRDGSLFLTREEAVAHFWQHGPVEEFYEVEEVETDAPSGNFQVVARCGFSGEWLGPPNFHGYQANLRRLHRERFANMSFDRYASRVRTERGEEAVNEWLESMKKRRRWRPKGGDDEAWTFERAEIERDFLSRLFGEAFEETREADLPGDVPATSLSIGVLAAVRIAGGHARRHPAMLIPSICKLLEAEHLAVFKKQGKLFCGPARPHPLAGDEVLSERPRRIVDWLDAHPDAKLGELWPAMLPEDAAEPPKEWLVDLFWLLTQGHVLLFSDDKLVLPKRRAQAAPKAAATEAKRPKKKRKRAKKSRKPVARPKAVPLRRLKEMNASQLRSLRGREGVRLRRLAGRRSQVGDAKPPRRVLLGLAFR